MRDFAREFYSSKAWQHCRASYMKKAGGLCERCLKQGLYTPAEIVHHKTWLNEENIKDESVTLNFANLEALCRRCHEEEHSEENRQARGRRSAKRYTVDREGHVTIKKAAVSV